MNYLLLLSQRDLFLYLNRPPLPRSFSCAYELTPSISLIKTTFAVYFSNIWNHFIWVGYLQYFQMETKTYSNCKAEKPISYYSKNCTRKDGKHTKCKPCQSRRHKIWEKGHRIHRNQYRKKKYNSNPQLRIAQIIRSKTYSVYKGISKKSDFLNCEQEFF